MLSGSIEIEPEPTFPWTLSLSGDTPAKAKHNWGYDHHADHGNGHANETKQRRLSRQVEAVTPGQEEEKFHKIEPDCYERGVAYGSRNDLPPPEQGSRVTRNNQS